MVPLDNAMFEQVLSWDVIERLPLSLRHALIHRRSGVFCDRAMTPKSVILLREAGPPDGWHVFGAGIPDPAINWLAELGEPFSIVAPESWEESIRARSTTINRGVVETWNRPAGQIKPQPAAPSAATRRLSLFDSSAFNATAPSWALWGWEYYSRLLRSGAAIGVPAKDGQLAAIAWIFEADRTHDAIAVSTDPRYRRLGLGRAAASALIEVIVSVRRKSPIWTVNKADVASKALARSLGFEIESRASILRSQI